MLFLKMLSNFYSFYLTAITDTHLNAEFSNFTNYLKISPVCSATRTSFSNPLIHWPIDHRGGVIRTQIMVDFCWLE